MSTSPDESVNRRQVLASGTIGISTSLFAGCLSRFAPTTGNPDESGSGHQCDNPRNIDYEAVDEYHDHGVYLENTDEAVHTACVTVTTDNRDREEQAPGTPPPLRNTGYSIHPEKAVEIFTFAESGQYTIRVSIEETTKIGSFDKTKAEFTNEKPTITTFEIVSPTNIRLTERDAP